MSSPTTPTNPTTPSKKTKNENLLGISETETKLLLLGMVCTSDAGKPDFAEIAPKVGCTLGSARTLHGVARRKLERLHGSQKVTGANDGKVTKPTPSPKTPRGCKATGSKKKAASKVTGTLTETLEASAPAHQGPSESDTGDAHDTQDAVYSADAPDAADAAAGAY
ncbi:histone h1.3 [Penicillium alfredii]|uniref:Histone h1.3 n=1 Tax=Penicillium alfredii TaxID=1506179 RepID=A0A9W9F9D9_9EURO|nr:histone h1.3 [Penicillium alfredii]KAJ5096042.1 histone h1.3 [Penicillium alfredii]